MNKDNIKKNINNLLKYFDLEEYELSKILFKINAFIGGSVPLNVVVQNEIFKNLDLDIFLPIPYTKEECTFPEYKLKNLKNFYPYEELAKDKIINYLLSKNYKLIKNTNYNYHKSDYNIPTQDIEYYKSGLSHFIKNITTFQKNNKNIQIITTYDWNIDDLLDTCDLNICKLAIISDCNHNLVIYKQHLSDEEYNNILERKMYITVPFYPANLEKRIQKYLDRNFTWIHSTTKELPSDPLNINCYLTTNFNYEDVLTFEDFIKYKKNIKKDDNVDDDNDDDNVYYEDNYDVYIKNSIIDKKNDSNNEEDNVGYIKNSIIDKENDSDNKKDYIIDDKKNDIDEEYNNIVNSITDELLEKGVEYMKKYNLIINCIDYKFSDKENKCKYIYCLDEFELIKHSKDHCEKICEYIVNQNICIKFDLNDIVNLPCFGLGIYIYKLLKHIKIKFK